MSYSCENPATFSWNCGRTKEVDVGFHKPKCRGKLMSILILTANLWEAVTLHQITSAEICMHQLSKEWCLKWDPNQTLQSHLLLQLTLISLIVCTYVSIYSAGDDRSTNDPLSTSREESDAHRSPPHPHAEQTILDVNLSLKMCSNTFQSNVNTECRLISMEPGTQKRSNPKWTIPQMGKFLENQILKKDDRIWKLPTAVTKPSSTTK